MTTTPRDAYIASMESVRAALTADWTKDREPTRKRAMPGFRVGLRTDPSVIREHFKEIGAFALAHSIETGTPLDYSLEWSPAGFTGWMLFLSANDRNAMRLFLEKLKG